MLFCVASVVSVFWMAFYTVGEAGLLAYPYVKIWTPNCFRLG
jgi:hypothetical protein